MKERPIIFSAPMVRAILAGTKTQTRRVVKTVGNDGGFVLVEQNDGSLWPHRSDDGESCFVTRRECDGEYLDDIPMRCHYGQPGDRLWVRETFAAAIYSDGMRFVEYKADRSLSDFDGYDAPAGGRWRPSIHMPRWASRITLEITDVRVELLQDISEADAKAEGVSMPDGTPAPPDFWSYQQEFRHLWEQINGPGSWDANPFVWVVTFRRIDHA